MNNDVIKAIRKGSREAEFETLGPGFHSKTKPHRSKKTFTRKRKHREDPTSSLDSYMK